MSQVIAELRHEHDAILEALPVLERMAERAAQGQLPAEDAGEFLDFLRAFVDQCHHGKEEALLFPALIAGGLMMIKPGMLTDIAGFVLFALVLVSQWQRKKAQRAAA